MLFRLLLLFTIVPIVELSLLIQLGQKIGLSATLAIVIFTGLLGAYLAREQGFITITRIRTNLQEGKIPGDPLIDGVLILAGGLLLVTPGLITDTVGFLILIPFTRGIIKTYIKQKIKQKFNSHEIHTTYRVDDF